MYTWERVTDLSLVGNCYQAMEGVAGQRPANVARMGWKSVGPILENFVLELKRLDEEEYWESKSSPILTTYDVRLMEPCINEAIGNETTGDNLIPLYESLLTMLTGAVGGSSFLSVHAYLLFLVCTLVTVSIQRGDSVGSTRVNQGELLTHC